MSKVCFSRWKQVPHVPRPFSIFPWSWSIQISGNGIIGDGQTNTFARLFGFSERIYDHKIQIRPSNNSNAKF